MEPLNLSLMTADQLQNRLLDIGLAMHDAQIDGEYERYEQMYAQYARLEVEFNHRGKEAFAGLFRLYEHDNAQVRLIAAIISYGSAPEAAGRVLDLLMDEGPMPQCAIAGFIIDDIRKGVLPSVDNSCRPEPFKPGIVEAHRKLLEPVDLSDFDMFDLVDRFLALGIAQEYALDNDESRKYDRLLDQMRLVDQKIRAQGQISRLAVLRLCTHWCLQVQLQAALFAYGADPKVARKCLQEIADLKISPQSWDAGSALWAIDNGRSELD